MLDGSLEIIKEDGKKTVNIDKDELLNIAKAIKQQQNEVSVLDDMLANSKDQVSDAFAKIIDSKLKDVSDKIESINSLIETIKSKATEEDKK